MKKGGFLGVFALCIVFLFLSCDTDPMDIEIKANPLVGSWTAIFDMTHNSVSSSAIHFLDDGRFFYYVAHFDLLSDDPIPPMNSLERFEGTYTFNNNVIFFDIREPAEQRGVTHSFFKITDGVSEDGEKYVALYARGEKFLFTSNLHIRQEDSHVVP